MPITIYPEKIRFLIGRRFPDYARHGKVPDVQVDALRQYETELKKLPRPTLDEHYIRAVEDFNREQEEAEERADRLEFFNRPDAAADFRYWCHLERWSVDETAALLLGKNPEKVSSSSLYSTSHGSPFRRAFQELKAKLSRAVDDGKLQKRDTPSNFFGWAERIGVPVPPELSARLEAGGDISIEGRERTSLHKLVIGMAVKFYGYDPSEPKSPVPSKIANDLAAFELDLTPETVRKYLRDASGQLGRNANKKDPQ
jgi:hypothetical protein